MAGDSAGGQEVGRVSIRVVPDLDKFYTELKDRLEEFEESLKCHIKVVPDMDEFREKVDAATRDLKDAKVKVKTDIDHNGDLIHDLEDLGRDAKLQLKTDLDKSSLEKSIGEAKLLARAADVKIRVRGDGGGGGGGGFFGDAARGASSGGFGGPGLLTSQAGLIGIAVIALLAPALALLSTALVSLPALVTAVALPLSVFAIGLGGIKKALDDSGILDDVTGKKGKSKQGLGAALKQVQQQVSDVFEKGFTPLFKQVAAVIPDLLRGLPYVATGIVNATKGLVGALTNPTLIAGFDRLTNSISTMLTNLGPGLGSFATGMSNLITNVGDHLPGLGTVMSGWADRFSNWVTKISKPKQNWFGGDIANSSTLDSAVTNLKPVLESVVNFVGRVTDAGLKLAANPDMAKNISTVLDGITNFIITGLPKLNEVFKGIADTMHMLGFDNPTKSDDKPGAGPGGKGSPPSKPGVDSKTGQFSSDLDGLKAEFDAGKGPLGWLHNAIKGSSKWLSDNVDPKTFFDDNNPKNFVNQPKNLVTMGPGGQRPAPQAPPPSKFSGAQAGGDIKTQLSGVKAAVDPAMAEISASTAKVWDAFVAATKKATADVMAEVSSWPGKIAQALTGLFAAGQTAGQALGTGMAAGIAAGAQPAIDAARALAQGVEAAAKGHLQINSPSKVFEDIGQGVGEGFTNGIEGGAQGVIDSARNLAKQVSDAVASGTAAPQLGKQIKEQIQAIDIEKQQLKVDSDSTSDKGQKKAIKGQIDQLNIAKSQLGLSKDQLKTGGDSTKQQMDALSIQEQQLRAEYNATSDKGKRKDLKAQMDALKLQKDQLKLYEMQHPESKDKKSDDMGQQLAGQLNKAVDIGKNFAMANVKQFEGDLGISGNGAIPQLADMGLNWMQSMLGGLVNGAMGGNGKPTQIHVNSVEEAFSAKQNADNKQAHQYAGR